MRRARMWRVPLVTSRRSPVSLPRHEKLRAFVSGFETSAILHERAWDQSARDARDLPWPEVSSGHLC